MLLGGVDDDQITLTERQLSPTAVDDDACATEAEQELGRAHYRALYFIARQPGLTISDLLALLGITKQSLGRVVKELEARDMLTTRPGNRDRRQKELRLTEAGRTIETAIFALLRDTMSRAYTHAGQQAVTGFWHVSEALVPARDRKRIAALGRDPT